MPVDICGFLEISGLDAANLHEDHAWMSCLNLGSLGLYMGDECRILFGESKYTVPHEWPPIAYRRGVPGNMGWLTAQAVEEALKNDDSIMSTWGFTYITYDEIASIDWQAYVGAELDGKSYGWGLLFSLMKTLDDASKHQRLVVWFEWP